MNRKPYFTLYEWIVIISLALASALINAYLSLKSIVECLGIPRPAAGMALFGGGTFVLWICLACRVIKKKCSGITTSVLIGRRPHLSWG